MFHIALNLRLSPTLGLGRFKRLYSKTKSYILNIYRKTAKISQDKLVSVNAKTIVGYTM